MVGDVKRIGILTSGGDAPGMNAAIRGAVRCGISHGCEMIGIEGGYCGLMDGVMREMNLRSVSDIISKGGTVLRTARSKEFSTKEGLMRAKNMAEIFRLDALIVIGGDGSFRGAKDLSEMGIKVMGIPATIDNDIGCTDYTIGYDTALNTVKDAIDKIKDTAYSHERCSIVEVMGRDAGYIALNTAIADGAEVAVLPEKDFDLNNDVIIPIINCRNRGKKDYIIVVAEGAADSMVLAEQIKEKLNIKPTVSILGYIQRGGSPTVRDRVTASLMAVKAVDMLCNGEYNKVMAQKGDKIVAFDIAEALKMKKCIDPDMIEAMQILSL